MPLNLCASLCLLPFLLAGKGVAADIRYNVTHLQPVYGEDLFFYGMSAGGLLTARSPSGYTTILGGDVKSFAYPFNDSFFQGYFGDTGVLYAERLGNGGLDTLQGVYVIDRDGNVTDTGYLPTGREMYFGRQNSRGGIAAHESGAVRSGGFLYAPESGGQYLETLGGVNVFSFNAINDTGSIIGIGTRTTAEGTVGGAWLWVPGQEAVLIRDGFPEARAINDAGQIIGRSGSAGYIWENGNFQVISNVLVQDPNNPAIIRNAAGSSSAHDLNMSGAVVGFSTLLSTPGYDGPLGERGWLWTEEEGLLFLDDLINPESGFSLQLGISIATDGTILAAGRIPGSAEVQHFLLTPIPEPGVPAFLLLAPACLLHRRRRCKAQPAA